MDFFSLQIPFLSFPNSLLAALLFFGGVQLYLQRNVAVHDNSIRQEAAKVPQLQEPLSSGSSSPCVWPAL